MKYNVVIEESAEGFAVSVPGLPGCHSQGETEAEALANIAEAIREYLDVVEELARSAGGETSGRRGLTRPNYRASITSMLFDRCRRPGIGSHAKANTS